MSPGLSVLVPVFNERQEVIDETIAHLVTTLQGLGKPWELIVIDDGSEKPIEIPSQLIHAEKIQLIRHPVNQGYGTALKTGLKAAGHPRIIISDSDGTYPIDQIPELVRWYDQGFDMVVGARQGTFYQGGFFKRLGRFFLTSLAEFVAGQRIPDINSGLRIFSRDKALQFLGIFPSGFSFTTTITLAFMLNHYFVHYFPIDYGKRDGSSKVRYLRDTLRTSQILLEAILVYNPAKLFILLGGIFLASALAGAILITILPLPGVQLLVEGTFGAQIIFALGLIPTYHRRSRNG